MGPVLLSGVNSRARDILALAKLLRRATSPSPEREPTGGGARATPHCFFLFSAVNTVLKCLCHFYFPHLLLLILILLLFIKKQKTLPYCCVTWFVAFCVVPVKDSVTFIPSSVLHGAPIKPFRRGGSVWMLPERRAAPAAKVI